MKKFVWGGFLAGIVILIVAATFPRTPIYNGILQDDLNANGQSVTNALNLVGTPYGEGSHLSNVTATASGAAGGVLGGTYPNPGFGSFSSATFAAAVTDENGTGPLLFSTGNGGGLTSLNGLAISNWPASSLMGNPNGGAASVIPITLDSTMSFVAGQLHSIGGGGGGGAASNAVSQIQTNGTAVTTGVTSNLNFNASSNIDVPATNGNGTVGIIPTLHSNLTSMTSVGFSGGGTVSGGGSGNIAITNGNGTVFIIDTNGLIQTVSGSGSISNGYASVIDARLFGVTTNGDQSVQIQNAINYSTNMGLGGIVELPDGILPATNLVFPQGLFIRGHSSQYGKLSSALTPGSQQGTIIYSGSYGGPVARLQGGGQLIENISFYSSGGGTAIQSDTNAPTTVSQYGTIQNCRIYGYNIGINGYYMENFLLLNNYLTCQTNYYFTNAANANFILSGHVGGGIYGVRLEAGTGNVCDGNHIFTTIEGCSNGVSIVGTSAESTEIDPPDMESNTNDVVVNGASGTKILGGHFDATVGGTNFVFVGAKGWSIAPAYVYDGARAFSIDATSFNGTIDVPIFGINQNFGFVNVKASPYRVWDGVNNKYVGGGITAVTYTNTGPTLSINSIGYAWPASQAGGNLFNNGSGTLSWVAGTNVSIPNTITPTNFVVNTRYTNSSGSIQLVDATVALITASVAGVAAMDLMADQAGGTAFVLQDRVAISTLLTGLTVNYTNNLSGALSNNATYYFTNTSSGAGNSSVIVPSTGELITLADGSAAGVALLSANNIFTGNNTFALGSGNGVGFTNLTYQYLTNYPGAQSMTFSQTAYWTNISTDTTIQAFTLGANGAAMYESLVLFVNNTDTSPHKITPDSRVFTEPGNVAGGVIWCTNGVVTEIDFAHFATRWTNAVVKQ